MDFHQFASKELSAFLERLTAAAAAQAEDARQRTRDEAQRTIDTVTAEKHKLEASLKDLRAQADSLRAKLQTAERACEQETRAKAAAESDLQKLRTAAGDHERARHQLESKLETVTASEKTLRVKLAEIEKQLARAERDVEAAAQEAEAVRVEADTARADADAARADADAARADAAAARADAAAAAQAAALREQRARSTPQPIDRLLSVFDRLAKATTVADVLTAVVQGLATEFSRVAAFSVSGNHLEGVHQVGFDFKSNISKVVIPLTMDSLLTTAATSGRVQGFVGSELTDSSCAPFGGNPAFVLTLPVTLRGETIAVIYADTEEQTTGGAAQRGVKFAELLLWHAVPMLGKVSVEHESTRDLRKYATLLLSEIENMFNTDTGDGLRSEELKSRLRDNLDCARRLYAQRVAADNVPAAAPLLDHQLAALVEARGDTAFGRDLGAVAAGRSADASRSTARVEREPVGERRGRRR